MLNFTSLSEDRAMRKVGFISLGCPKNLVDSEVMMGILERSGYELTPRADDADVLVVNTCSFIEAAQQESVDTILEMAEHKKFGRAQKAAIIRARFASFRSCAEIFAAAALNPSFARRKTSPQPASAKLR